MHACPTCQSDRVIHNGSAAGKPKKHCKQCGYQFTRTTPRGKPRAMKVNAVLWYLSGMSMNRIAFLLRVSAQAVLTWIRDGAKDYDEKPEPTGRTIVLELDEMWHYLTKKRHKLWIWKALDRDTGQLLDWECGRRDKKTLKKMVDRLTQWDVQLYCTDTWAPYAAVLPQEKLAQRKATTHDIERNHCRQRHWFGRFKRKSIIVSKSKEMVDLTMGLFAKFWVNGNQDELLSGVCVAMERKAGMFIERIYKQWFILTFRLRYDTASRRVLPSLLSGSYDKVRPICVCFSKTIVVVKW